MKTKLNLLLLAAATAVSIGVLEASDLLITTSEGAGAFNTTLNNASAYTFDNLPTGANHNVNWVGVGSIDAVGVLNADQYGGAPKADGTGSTPYAVQSTASRLGGVATTTLTLNSPSSYFGLYWSAGDSANVLNFYNGNNLLATFTTDNLIKRLSSAYSGNPSPDTLWKGQDSGEKFGFINFIGGANTSWDKIVFSNSAGSGFESDNWTSRVNGWNPTVDGALPGTPQLEIKNGTISTISSIPAGFVPAAPGAPAPPLAACLAFAGVLILQALRRNKMVA